MSSYFDSFDQTVRDASTETRGNDAAFLKRVQQLEAGMVRTCELFAGDHDTPHEVQVKVMNCIFLNRVRFAGDVEGLGDSEANAEVACMRRSKLSAEMHRLFHEIASMRIQARYGPIMDNPEAAVRARDAHAERKAQRAANRAAKMPNY